MASAEEIYFERSQKKNTRSTKKGQKLSNVIIRVNDHGRRSPVELLLESSHPGVEYSLNKKQRWNLLDGFRQNMGSLNEKECRVEAAEYEARAGKKGFKLRAVHTVDDEGHEIHKFSRRSAVQYKFNEEVPPKKKDRKVRKSRNANVNVEPVVRTSPEIRYEILTQPQPHGKGSVKKPKFRSPVKLSSNTKVENDYYVHSMDSGSIATEIDSDDSNGSAQLSNVVLGDFLVAMIRLKKSKKSNSVKPKTANSIDKRSFIQYVEREEEEADNETTITTPASKTFLLDYDIVPIELFCISQDLEPSVLATMFKDSYVECRAMLPRRFQIDVSERVVDAAKSTCSEVIRKEVKCLVSTEVVKQCDDLVSLIRVSLNANVTKDFGSLSLDCLNPCGTHSMANIVDSAVKCLFIFHSDSFRTPKPIRRTFNISSWKMPFYLINPYQYVDSTFLPPIQFDAHNDDEANSSKNTCPIHECEICYLETDHGFSLKCGHYFCESCWKAHCTEKIRTNLVPIKCPQIKCESVVDYLTLTTFMPFSICLCYTNQLRNANILRNADKMVWCRSPNCGLLKFESITTTTNAFHCLCGTTWCAKCSSKGGAHWPISCKTLQQYLFKLNENADDYIPWFNNVKEEKFVMVKQCPHCQQQVEKVDGCDYIYCVCTNIFCWRCLKPWNHGNDHFGCKDPIAEQQAIELQKVEKKSDGFLKKSLYNQALFHRRANFPPARKNFQAVLRKFVDRSRNRQFYMNVVEVRKQSHTVLEYVYVWLGTDCRNRDVGQIVKNACHRLEIQLNLLENVVGSEKDRERLETIISELFNAAERLISKVKEQS